MDYPKWLRSTGSTVTPRPSAAPVRGHDRVEGIRSDYGPSIHGKGVWIPRTSLT